MLICLLVIGSLVGVCLLVGRLMVGLLCAYLFVSCMFVCVARRLLLDCLFVIWFFCDCFTVSFKGSLPAVP